MAVEKILSTASNEMDLSNPVQDAKIFALQFTAAVTETTMSRDCLLARNGKESLFSLMRQVFPQVCQVENNRRRLRSKISWAEFNSLVESECGFETVRYRKKPVTSAAGTMLWCGRRWRDPSKPEDLAVLKREFYNLCVAFPAFSATCSQQHFICSLGEIVSSWSQRLERSRRVRSVQQPARNIQHEPLDVPVKLSPHLSHLPDTGFDHDHAIDALCPFGTLSSEPNGGSKARTIENVGSVKLKSEEDPPRWHGQGPPNAREEPRSPPIPFRSSDASPRLGPGVAGGLYGPNRGRQSFAAGPSPGPSPTTSRLVPGGMGIIGALPISLVRHDEDRQDEGGRGAARIKREVHDDDAGLCHHDGSSGRPGTSSRLLSPSTDSCPVKCEPTVSAGGECDQGSSFQTRKRERADTPVGGADNQPDNSFDQFAARKRGREDGPDAGPAGSSNGAAAATRAPAPRSAPGSDPASSTAGCPRGTAPGGPPGGSRNIGERMDMFLHFADSHGAGFGSSAQDLEDFCRVGF